MICFEVADNIVANVQALPVVINSFVLVDHCNWKVAGVAVRIPNTTKEKTAIKNWDNKHDDTADKQDFVGK